MYESDGPGSGGGIYACEGSDTSISYSTVANNDAYKGGGIHNDGGHLTLANATVSGNSSDHDAAACLSVAVQLRSMSSTITGNDSDYYAGGIDGGGDLTIENSIVSGNTSYHYYGSELRLSVDTVVSSSHNVFGTSALTNNEAFHNFTPSATDFNATSDHNNVPLADILNTTLANNGGPTLTHALVSDSPAIDFAPNSECSSAPLANDQRHLPRNVDIPGTGNDSNSNLCDAGAFELQMGTTGEFCPSTRPSTPSAPTSSAPVRAAQAGAIGPAS